MGNTFLTPQIVANEALMQLEANLVMVGLVHKDYSSEFDGAVGDTITVKKPAKFVAKDFNGEIDVQDITEGNVQVKMDRLVDVSFKFTSKERSLDIKDLSAQAIQPAVLAIADRIDKDILNEMANINASVSGTKNATKLTDIGNLAKTLDIAKVPTSNRRFVMCPEHRYRYLDTDLSNASFSGGTAALRQANLGKIYNFDTFMDQNCLVSDATTPGTITACKVTGTKGETKLAVTGATPATGTLAKGDQIVVDGRRYTVVEDATAASGAIAELKIDLPLHATVLEATSAYVVTKVHSLAFHRNAIAFVNRTLTLPRGGVEAAISSHNGIGIRAVFGYDQKTKTEICSLDVLYGIKTLDPSMAVKLVG